MDIANPVTLHAAIADLDPHDVVDGYDRLGLATLDDTSLLSAVAGVIGEPKAAPPDSFVLHAPLEVLARATLLQHCSPSARDQARRRLVWVAATYARAGEAMTRRRMREPGDAAGAAETLVAAIADGDLDAAGGLGRWIGDHVDALDVATLLGDALVTSLAAAAHGSIFLHLLPRIGARSAPAGAMLGNLTRELARFPDWRLRWVDEVAADGSGPSLGDALASMPVLTDPGPDSFIFPLMSQAETTGIAPSTVGPSLGHDLARSTLEILRVSTESMLLDDPDRAPYGWSHCLTLPQAVLGIAPRLADPTRAVAVAGTYVAGFRGALGWDSLTTLRLRPRPVASDAFSLDDAPDSAAATMAALSGPQRGTALRTVVDHAAAHPDAHLAKYTVACLDAARTDPTFADQHLAAAAKLASWWQQLPVTDDPLLG